ncbi:MAG: tetratricopeptide repeat protein [Planctomycetota bacterium]|nr:tetratricopeptide repeat protein [Planctomycetota bacterium]
MQKFLKSIARKVRKGELSLALTETKQSVSEQDRVGQKVQCYLLLKNQKYPEADALATKMLSSGLDHELLCWRGIARAELGLWFSALEDLCLSQEIFPKRSTKKRIDHTTRRACENISEGMQLDGGNFKDYFERAKIYLLNHDYSRASRDLDSAEALKPDANEIARFRAEIEYARGNLAESLEKIDLFLDNSKEDLEATLLKARIKADTGRLRAALGLLRKTARSHRKKESSLLKIANCRVAIRDFHGAIRDFDSTIELNENCSAAYFGRGRALLEIRQYDQSVKDFEKAIQLGGSNATLHAHLGEALLSKAAQKEASASFKKALKIEPDCWQARLGYARVRQMRNKRTEALQVAQGLLEKQGEHHEVHLFLGSLHFDEKDFVSAIDRFTDAIKNCRNRFETASCLYRRGSAHLENEQIPEAIDDFDKALKLRPFHVGTLVWRGYANAKQGRWANAISDLQAAIDMNPMASEQYQKLGEFIAQQAIRHFGSVIRENKSDAEAYFNRGMANLFLGNQDKAYLDFEKTLQLAPRNGEAQVRLGTLFLKDNQSKKAYSFFSDAMKSKPSAQALLLRAEAMLQLGVIQPALLDIRDAIRTSRNNDRLYVRRGELHALRGNLEKALDDFTLSIALNFDNYQAFRERGRLFLRRGLLPEAADDLTMSLHFFPKQPDLLRERGEIHLKLEHYEQATEDFELALGYGHCLKSYIGRGMALLNLERGQEALIWLTKAVHRFDSKAAWAEILRARAEIFLALGRFERASADARMASKLNSTPEFASDCYYLRALCSFYHKDRDHAIKTLEKANNLDENHEMAELALDWFREMADQPPTQWLSPPTKVRPTRPSVCGNPEKIEFDQKTLEAPAPMDLWLVKQEDEEFGPIPLKTVISWASEGRISAESMLFRTDWGKWRSAAKVLPQFANKSHQKTPKAK